MAEGGVLKGKPVMTSYSGDKAGVEGLTLTGMLMGGDERVWIKGVGEGGTEGGAAEEASSSGAVVKEEEEVISKGRRPVIRPTMEEVMSPAGFELCD